MSQTLLQPTARLDGLRSPAWVEPMVERRAARRGLPEVIEEGPAERATKEKAPDTTADSPTAGEDAPRPEEPHATLSSGAGVREELSAGVRPVGESLTAVARGGDQAPARNAVVLSDGQDNSFLKQQSPGPVARVVEGGLAPRHGAATIDTQRWPAPLVRPAGFPAASLDLCRQPAGPATGVTATVFPNAAVASERSRCQGAPEMAPGVSSGRGAASAQIATARLRILFGTLQICSPGDMPAVGLAQRPGPEDEFS